MPCNMPATRSVHALGLLLARLPPPPPVPVEDAARVPILEKALIAPA
jgi:hypothetical protein